MDTNAILQYAVQGDPPILGHEDMAMYLHVTHTHKYIYTHTYIQLIFILLVMYLTHICMYVCMHVHACVLGCYFTYKRTKNKIVK